KPIPMNIYKPLSSFFLISLFPTDLEPPAPTLLFFAKALTLLCLPKFNSPPLKLGERLTLRLFEAELRLSVIPTLYFIPFNYIQNEKTRLIVTIVNSFVLFEFVCNRHIHPPSH